MNRGRLMRLLVTQFLAAMGFSVLFPVEAYFIDSMNMGPAVTGILMMLYALSHFFMAPIWGRVSDRIGRKPVLLFGLFGYGVTAVLFALSTSAWQLFLTRALVGVCSSASLPSLTAMVADQTTDAERTRGVGLLGAAFGMAALFGPAIGGMTSGVSLRLPYFIAGGIVVFAGLMAALIVPESLAPELRGQEGPVVQRSRLRWAAPQPELLPIYIVMALSTFATSGLMATFTWLAARRFDLAPMQASMLFLAMGVTAGFVQGFLVGRVKPILGEINMMRIGLFGAGLGYLVLALAPSPLFAVLGLVVFELGDGLFRPALTSLVSQRAQTGQGLAIGTLDTFEYSGRVVGPLTAGALFGVASGLPYLVNTVMAFGAGGLMLLFNEARAFEKIGQSRA